MITKIGCILAPARSKSSKRGQFLGGGGSGGCCCCCGGGRSPAPPESRRAAPRTQVPGGGSGGVPGGGGDGGGGGGAAAPAAAPAVGGGGCAWKLSTAASAISMSSFPQSHPPPLPSDPRPPVDCDCGVDGAAAESPAAEAAPAFGACGRSPLPPETPSAETPAAEAAPAVGACCASSGTKLTCAAGVCLLRACSRRSTDSGIISSRHILSTFSPTRGQRG